MDAGKREVYTEFIQTTMPDFNSNEVPAATSADRKFLLQPGNTVSPTLPYKDWGGNNRSAWLSGC